jgi:hypothetical protein
VAGAIGIATGQMYRSDLVNLKAYRLPASIERFSKRFLLPLIGSTRPPRRSNQALPQEVSASGLISRQPGSAGQTNNGGETPPTEQENIVPSNDGVAPRPSAMTQWVDELTGRRGQEGVYVPTADEVNLVANVFPDLRREEIISALQRK